MFDQYGDGLVFIDTALHRGVPADLFIYLALDQDELTVGNGIGVSGVIYPLDREAEG